MIGFRKFFEGLTDRSVEYGRGPSGIYNDREWKYVGPYNRDITNFRIGNDVYGVFIKKFKSGAKLELARVGYFTKGVTTKEKLIRTGNKERYDPSYALGKANAIKVFSSVLSIALDYAQSNNVAYFYFDGHTDKLQRAYEAIISARSTQRIITKHGFHQVQVPEEADKGFHNFIFIVKNGFDISNDFKWSDKGSGKKVGKKAHPDAVN